ncbi:NAD-dependent epimerase/dehydratase family protein [Campylobacter sp. faydin G-105]|uniref:NAD-dependent epimerase/dehydratase family protein n=1 Tax=Campylobacter anatolicus TaxID=2829105 RepID=UPI001B8E60C4|nr:NAD-dependent epimerase/dehydratase family protein [Campylobacter anatolicus]MBR8462241.1 NAD-dependent epimerase/dehydratase family protein [Campylobacter anatolicus]
MLKNALVVGASGVVGREIVRQLCSDKRYAKIYIFVRREFGFKHEKLVEKIINFDEILSEPRFEVNEIFCALGTTIKQAKTRENFKKVDFDYVVSLAKWGKNVGVTKFVLFSSFGADVSSKSFYLRIKGETERAISEIGFKSVHIVRSPLIDGKRDDARLGERLLINIFKFMPTNLLTGYQPLSGESIAKAAIKMAQSSDRDIEIYRPRDIL